MGVFLIITNVYSRTPNPEENHIIRALEGVRLEAVRRFGENQADRLIKETIARCAKRDHLLQLMGMGLIHLQTIEHLIKMCCSLLNISLSTDEFLSNSPKVRRETLGSLKRALKQASLFSDEFESKLDSFVYDRNRFIHSFWMELALTPSNPFDLLDETSLTEISNFLQKLSFDAQQIEATFRGLFIYCYKQSDAGKQDPGFMGFDSWAKHIFDFNRAVRKPES